MLDGVQREGWVGGGKGRDWEWEIRCWVRGWWEGFRIDGERKVRKRWGNGWVCETGMRTKTWMERYMSKQLILSSSFYFSWWESSECIFFFLFVCFVFVFSFEWLNHDQSLR